MVRLEFLPPLARPSSLNSVPQLGHFMGLSYIITSYDVNLYTLICF